MKTRLTRFALTFAAAALLLAVAAPVAAMPPEVFGTPDGMTPAQEDICDETTGKANGLCVAYCEAMDCDSENPNASSNACTNVAAKFTQITGEIVPCLRVCPCWEEAELESVTAANNFFFSCLRGTFFGAFDPNGVLIQNNTPAPGVEGGFATGNLNPTTRGCATRDMPPFVLAITEQEYEVCSTQIEDRCAAIGFPIP